MRGRPVGPDGEGWTGSWDWQHVATFKFLLWSLWEGSHLQVNTQSILKDFLATKFYFLISFIIVIFFFALPPALLQWALQGMCNVMLKYSTTSNSFLCCPKLTSPVLHQGIRPHRFLLLFLVFCLFFFKCCSLLLLGCCKYRKQEGAYWEWSAVRRREAGCQSCLLRCR